jgi:O-antigen ligase
MLAFLVLRNRRGGSIVRALIIFSGCGLLLWDLTHRVAFLNERFFGGDQATVRGINLNTEGRSVLWSRLWTVAEDNLWIGHGAGTATDLARANFARAGEPHNDYLRFIVDYGLIGCAIWLIAILTLLHRLWRRARARSGNDAAIHYSAFLAVLGTSLVAITDNVLIYHYVLLPVAVLVGCSLAHPMKADSVERAPGREADRGISTSSRPT